MRIDQSTRTLNMLFRVKGVIHVLVYGFILFLVTSLVIPFKSTGITIIRVLNKQQNAYAVNMKGCWHYTQQQNCKVAKGISVVTIDGGFTCEQFQPMKQVPGIATI